MSYRYVFFVCVLALSNLVSCGAAQLVQIESAISHYNQNIGQVRLGMSEKEVRSVLGDPGPSGSVFPVERTTTADGTPITILYYRTARIPDGRTTKDEMIPLLFVGDGLRAIGWTALQIAEIPKTGPATKETTGTCFAVRPDGVLVTAYHIVKDAKSIRIQLANGTVTKAKVEKVTPQNDLAILRINYQTRDFLPLAPAGTVRIGERVFTIGYPATDILGQEPKFTEGSVSALSGIGGEAALLQMSVPVQPGSSGGPLVNERGEAVGVVTSTAAVKAFLSATGTLPQNVNWAVKADYARLMFNAPTVKSLAANRAQAIEWTRRAICMVEASPR